MLDFNRSMTSREEEVARLDRFTPREAGEYFGVTSATVLNWIHDGCLNADKEMTKGKTENYRYFVPASELDRLDREIRLFSTKLRKYLVRPLWKMKKP